MTTNVDPLLALIVAVAENGVIGCNNALPWRLSSDLKRFKAVTMGKPVIMGRKTFQSIGKPLPGRTIIVITRDPEFKIEEDDVIVTRSLNEAIACGEKIAVEKNIPEIMVAGGADIYKQTLVDADRLYLTTVHTSPEGDAHFPNLDRAEWQLVHSEKLRASDRDSAPTTYEVFDRL